MESKDVVNKCGRISYIKKAHLSFHETNTGNGMTGVNGWPEII